MVNPDATSNGQMNGDWPPPETGQDQTGGTAPTTQDTSGVCKKPSIEQRNGTWPPPGTKLVLKQSATLTPYTDKQGVDLTLDDVKHVPLYPVLYALGDDNSRTPNIDGSKIVDPLSPGVPSGAVDKPTKIPASSKSPFKLIDCDSGHQKTDQKASQGSEPKDMPVGPGTHYTLRRLRSGYLYVFSELDQGWRVFSIEKAFPALSLMGTYYAPGSSPWIDPLIDPLNQPTLSGVLSVPENINVWLAFSDAPWTERTLRWAQKLDEKQRSWHMRKFNSGTWKSDPKHMAPLVEAEKWVADIAPGMHENVFWFSREPFVKFSMNYLLMGTSQTDVPDGAVIALEDPIGIAMDLATLMDGRIIAFEQSPDPNCPGRTIEWSRMSYHAIEGVQATVFHQREYKVYDDNRNDINSRDRMSMTMENFLDFIEKPEDKTFWDVNKAAMRGKPMDPFVKWVNDKLDRDLAQAEKIYWGYSYTSRYREGQRQDWKKATEKLEKEYAEKVIMPLAQVFVAWTESSRFLAYFNGSFDSKDARSGVLFTSTLNGVYAGVQNKKPIYDHLLKWLKKDLTPDNLIGRALLLNHKSTIKELRDTAHLHGQALEQQLDLKWDKRTQNFQKLLIKAGKDVPKAAAKWTETMLKAKSGKHIGSLAALYANLTGPFTEVGSLSRASRLGFNSLAALGIVSDLPAIPVDMNVDLKKEFFENVLEKAEEWSSKGSGQAELSSNQKSSLQASARMLSRRMKGFKNLVGTKTKVFINIQAWQKLKANPVPFQDMKAMRKGTLDAKPLEELIITEGELRDLSIYQWKHRSPEAKANSVPGMFRIAQGIWQAIDIFAKWQELRGNPGAGKKEYMAFLGASCSLLGNIGETIEKTVTTFSRISGSGMTFGKVFSAFSFTNTNGAKVSLKTWGEGTKTLKTFGLRWVGRAFSVAGGIFTAYLDWIAADNWLFEGYKMWSFAYRASSYLGYTYVIATMIGWFFGTSLGSAVLAGAIGLGAKALMGVAAAVGVKVLITEAMIGTAAEFAVALIGYVAAICVVLVIIIALILILKPNNFQKWLDKCCWGSFPNAQRFPNIQAEHDEYVKITGAV